AREPAPATAAALAAALGVLGKAGGRIASIEVPDSERIYPEYMTLLYGDGGAAVARLLDRWGSTESPLRERLSKLPTLSSGELTAHYEWLDRWRSRMLGLFAEHDVIVCPANSGPAPRYGELDRASAAYTQIFNVTGWPATVVRAGTSPEGLPIGVQVVARPWREDVSFAVAQRIEDALGPFAGPDL